MPRVSDPTSLPERRQRLEKACDALGISMAELARRVGISRQYVYHLLSGVRRGKARGDLWEKMAAELRVDVIWLNTGANPPTWATTGQADKALTSADALAPRKVNEDEVAYLRDQLYQRRELSRLSSRLDAAEERIQQLEVALQEVLRELEAIKSPAPKVDPRRSTRA